jgi:hypothetical protein
MSRFNSGVRRGFESSYPSLFDFQAATQIPLVMDSTAREVVAERSFPRIAGRLLRRGGTLVLLEEVGAAVAVEALREDLNQNYHQTLDTEIDHC